MNKKLEDILMDGIENMYELMKNIGKPNFNKEDAKMKIAINNSITSNARTLIQYGLLKVALKNSGVNTTKVNSELIETTQEV